MPSVSENISELRYYPNGKIKKIIFINGDTSEFVYGAMGEKIKNKCYSFGANKYKYTWYVGPYVYEHDESGLNTFVIKEAKFPGGVIRVGNSTNVGNGYLVYHLTDHLGSVRVSFTARTPSLNTNGNGIEILSYNDYYAFGGPLPGRSYSSENYRYGFQGQEKTGDGTIWDQFELRSYNHDLGRWFAPDPYSQFASPYVAMANNPVSKIDPDGGYVMSGDDYGGPGYGQYQDKIDRSLGNGAYSTASQQKRYEESAKLLRDRYLLNGYQDQPRDVGKFLDAMQALNNYFCGIPNGNSVAMGYGDTYLSRGEVCLNLDKVKDLVKTIPTGAIVELKAAGMVGDRVRKAQRDAEASWESTGREAVVGWTAVNVIMDQNGNSTGHIAVITHNLDGSETVVEYDENGEKREDGSPKIDHISFLTADDVNARNNRVAGSTFDTRTFVDVGGGFMGPTTPLPLVSDGGGKGSIAGLPDIAPNMFPGVGIEVNVLATITGKGYYDNKTKTLQLPIGAKTSYAQHEYGHHLQSKQMPASCYDALERASFKNAMLQFLPGLKSTILFGLKGMPIEEL